jgi:thiazole synthase ThiGH ThiG subunit
MIKKSAGVLPMTQLEATRKGIITEKSAGATSVMPAGNPIGSGHGALNPNNLRIILDSVPGW